jgi:manganese-dependent inorganic pyrophosphatase
MEKQLYVIGHRNPDTDSVVSAAAYARLKQIQGLASCLPARAGKLSPQTEYIFERFGVPVPEYLPEMIPKAGYYLQSPRTTVPEDRSLWEALEQMHKEGLRVLPVVDKNGIYRSMLHYRGFARYIISNINPDKKSRFPVSIAHLVSTLRAQPILLYNTAAVRKSPIIVAATYNRYFTTHLEEEDPENALVIMGDRFDLQRYCLERKVRALILSNSHTLSPELAALAESNQVSVMSSPYDTSSTAMLIIYSAPVGAIGDDSVPLIRLTDPIKNIRKPLSQAPSRCLPVGDKDGHVAGVLFDGDLAEEPNIEIIMVDHNERSQAIEGIEHYRILEVIDHHRLGNFATRYPITFINRVVGATCTIITNIYREQKIRPEPAIAAILLCGILADTLSLHSATTTEIDEEAARYLSDLTGLNIERLGQELQAAANKVNALPAEELIRMDLKEYAEQGAEFTVSQVETDHTDTLIARKQEIFAALEAARGSRNRLFSALLVTDVLALDSFLFVSGKNSFTSALGFPQIEEGIYILKDVVSRKKQLIPLLAEIIEKAAE